MDGQTDSQTDGQNYDSQDRASIAASRSNNKHSATVSLHFTRASVFMIYNGSEFVVFRLYQNRTITQTQQIKMHILNQVHVNLIYNTNCNLFLWTKIFISTVQRTFTIQLPTDGRATCRIQCTCFQWGSVPLC